MNVPYVIGIQLQYQGVSGLGGGLEDIRRQIQGASGSVRLDTTAAQASASRLAGGLTQSQVALQNVQAQAKQTTASLLTTASATGTLSFQLANFSTQAGLAARRAIAFSLAAGGLYKLVQAVKDGLSAAVAFDLSMNKVAQVSGDSSAKIAELRGEISRLSTSLGVSSAELAETAITLKQAGLSANDTVAALRALALTDLAPTFNGMKQSTEGLIAASRQFNIEGKDFENTLGSMNAVAAAFAVESSDLISAVQKAGGAFKQTGGDINEFMALFTAVRSTTREGAEEIATGLRTIFTRLQRADTVAALKDLQVNLRYTADEADALGNRSLENQFVGAYEAVRRLSSGLKDLQTTDPRYSAVVEQLGGYRQISRVIPLLKNFEDAEKAKNVAIAGGITLQAAAEKRQEALAAKLAKVKEAYLDVARHIVDSKGFQGAADTVLKLASSFATLLDNLRPLVPIITTLLTAKLVTNLGNIAGNFGGSFLAPVGSTFKSKPVTRASGGQIPGFGNEDSVHALLTPGEFVFSKSAVARYGAATLREMNDGGRLKVQRFATGGQVDGAFLPNANDVHVKFGDDIIKAVEGLAKSGKELNKIVAAVNLLAKTLGKTVENETGIFSTSGKQTVFKGFAGVHDQVDSYGSQVFKLPTTVRTIQSIDKGYADTVSKPVQTVRVENTAELAEAAKARAASAAQEAAQKEIESAKSKPVPKSQTPLNDDRQQIVKDAVANLADKFTASFSRNRGLVTALGGEEEIRSRVLASFVASAQSYDEKKNPNLNAYFYGNARRQVYHDSNVQDAKTNNLADRDAQIAHHALLPDKDQRELAEYRARVLAATGFDLSTIGNAQSARGDKKAEEKGNYADHVRLAQNFGVKIGGKTAAQIADEVAPIIHAKVVNYEAEQAAKAAGLPPQKPPTAPPVATSPGSPTPPKPPQGKPGKVYSGIASGVSLDDALGIRRGPSQQEIDAAVARHIEIRKSERAEAERVDIVGPKPNPFRDISSDAIERSRSRRLAKQNGIGGETDPDKIKEAVFGYLRSGNIKGEDELNDVLGFANKNLSANQFRLIQAEARKQGYTGPGTPATKDPNIASERTKKFFEVITKSEDLFATHNAEELHAKRSEKRRSDKELEEFSKQFPNTSFGRAFRGADSFLVSPFKNTASLFSTASTGLSAANDRIRQKLGGAGQGFGNAAIVGLPFAADQFDKAAGSPEAAIASARSTSNYKTLKGVGGAIQGATVGGLAGASLGGPIGAAVGAVAGGLYGLVSALDEASKDVSKSKIANSLTTFSDKLAAVNAALAGGYAAVDTGTLLATKDEFKKTRSEDAALNAREATHTFGGFDSAEFSVLQRKSNRQNFGQQLPQIAGFINKQAEDLGKANIGKNATDLAAEIKAGGQGLNKEFIELLASIRGLSINQVMDEIAKTIASAQSREKVEQASKKAQAVNDQNLNAFGRLLSAVQASSDSLELLRTKAQTLGEVFDNTIAGTKVNFGAERLDQFGREDGATKLTLGTIASVTGKSGQAFASTGGIVDDIARVLPSVLGSSLLTGVDKADLTKEVSDGVAAALGYKSDKVPDSVRNVINTITAELAKDTGDKGPEGARQKAKLDVTKYSESLLSPAAEPFKRLGGEITKKLEDNANNFIDGLASLANRTQAIGQIQDQLGELKVSGFRTELQFKAEAAGRPGQAFDKATLAELEAGFNERQQRLATTGGLNVQNAFNPQEISKQLLDVRSRIPAAVEKQQQAYEKNPNSAEAKAAANELVNLRSQSNNLVQALRNLADISTRSAVIQEKLNRLRDEESGRRSLVERFVTADPDERAKLNRGLLLANEARNNPGTFEQLLAEDRRLIVDVMRAGGGATATGFKGAPRFDDALNNLLDEVIGAGLNKDQKDERKNLQDEQRNRQKTAEQALTDLITVQQNSVTQLKDVLATQQERFFTRLASILEATQLTDVKNKAFSAGVDNIAAQKQLTQIGLLKQIGFTDGGQVKENLDALNKYITSSETIQKLQESVKGVDTKVVSNFDSIGFKPKEINTPQQNQQILDYLNNNFTELGPDSRDRIAKTFRNTYKPETRTTKEGELILNDSDENKRLAKFALINAIRAELTGGGADTEYGKAVNNQIEADRKLSGLKGFNPYELISRTAPGKTEPLKELREAISAFGDGKSFTDVTLNADKAAKSLAELQKAVKALESTIKEFAPPEEAGPAPRLAEGHALGGSIFAPRGTDTVPAMLTPGEYVVNAASAKANAHLLEKINRAKGTVYHAEGGLVGLMNHSIQQALFDEINPQSRFLRTMRENPEMRNPIAILAKAQYRALGGRIEDIVNGAILEEKYGQAGFPSGPLPTSAGQDKPYRFADGPGALAGGKKISESDLRGEGRKGPQDGRVVGNVLGESVLDVDSNSEEGQALRLALAIAKAQGKLLTPEEQNAVIRRSNNLQEKRRFAADEEKRQREENGGGAIALKPQPVAAAAPPLDPLDFFAKASPGSESSFIKARADAVARAEKHNAIKGNVNQVDPELRGQQAVDSLYYRAGVDDFNRRSFYANAPSRAGEEGQRNLYGSLVAGQQTLRDQAYRRASSAFNIKRGINAGIPLPLGGLNKNLEKAFERKKDKDVRRFATGGMVPGIGIGDTVPSLLTPGEFVLNRTAVARAGVPALQHFNAGGLVGAKYLADGGSVGGGGDSAAAMTALATSMAQFGQYSQGLSQTMNVFAGSANTLSEAISKIPTSLSITGQHTVNVNLNGAEALAKLAPEIRNMVESQVKSSLGNIFKNQLPDAGVSLE